MEILQMHFVNLILTLRREDEELFLRQNFYQNLCRTVAPCFFLYYFYPAGLHYEVDGVVVVVEGDEVAVAAAEEGAADDRYEADD